MNGQLIPKEYPNLMRSIHFYKLDGTRNKILSMSINLSESIMTLWAFDIGINFLEVFVLVFISTSLPCIIFSHSEYFFVQLHRSLTLVHVCKCNTRIIVLLFESWPDMGILDLWRFKLKQLQPIEWNRFECVVVFILEKQ